MSYSIFYSGKADAQLDHLPVEFVDVVEEMMIRLAAGPTTVSVPIASPPFPPRGQLYHFDVDGHDGKRWFFTVIFRYSQDETAIHILSVTWRELIEE